MSNALQTGLEIIHHLTTPRELALLIAAAIKRMLELSPEDGELKITEELKQRINAIEARHTREEGTTYSKEEFRQHLDQLI